MKFLPERKKAGTSEKKSRLSANITLSVPLWSAAPVPPAAEAARSAPAHFGAAFLRHTRASRHPPAQTHTRSGPQQAARLKKGAGFPQGHVISYLQSVAPFLSAKKALDLVRENQQSSAHNFVKDFSSVLLKSSRRSPLKKGADSKNSLNMENQRFKPCLNLCKLRFHLWSYLRILRIKKCRTP